MIVATNLSDSKVELHTLAIDIECLRDLYNTQIGIITERQTGKPMLYKNKQIVFRTTQNV